MTEPDGAERLDPALRAIATTRTDFSLAAIQLMREPFDERRRVAAEQTDAPGVEIVEDGAPAEYGRVPVRVYRGGRAPAPAVVYCHAGGFALGNLDTDHRQCVELARRGRCTVVSVDYRLAPEHPHPAALEDASAVLRWVAGNAAAHLGVDPARVAVAGSSAGATLAACLAHGAADGSLPPVVFQLLHQPVLDDRPTASKAEFRTSPAFDGEAADLMWRYYLGPASGSDAVPARRGRFGGLPPALITCAEIDPFRDEAVDYALLLLGAGVSAELHVFPRTCHGFDSLLPDWSVSEWLFALQGHALSRAWGGPGCCFE